METSSTDLSVLSWRFLSTEHAFIILPTVYGLKMSNDMISRFLGPLRLSRLGHFAPSLKVPAVARYNPGIIKHFPLGAASKWVKGKSEVSKIRVCLPRMMEKGPTLQGHIMYENEPALVPRSSFPSCTGPSLYIWLDWFVPLPAL